MSLFERCVQLSSVALADKTDMCIQAPASEADAFTLSNALTIQPKGILKVLFTRVFYISDIHLAHKVANKFKQKVSDEQVEKYIKLIANDLLTEEMRDAISLGNSPIVLFGGDISSDFELARIFYVEFMEQWKKARNYDLLSDKYDHVYAILGNHEFWSFKGFDDCYTAYRELFQSLDICFLENTMTWLGKYSLPIKRVQSSIGKIPQYIELRKEDDEPEYESQMRNIDNVLIVGGVGFAKYNCEFNAGMGIYGSALSREQEIEETIKWETAYNSALQRAREINSVLLVLTHNPIHDWKENGTGDSGCIYFNGHNHRNDLYHDEDSDIHIFANNQIGYYNSKVRFKEAYIYNRINPFAKYGDGYHEINSTDYLGFCDYMRVYVEGTGIIDRQLKTQNTHFYMIKHSGYYGFFIVSPKSTCICAGGRIKKISTCTDIEQFDSNFLKMIKKYICVLSPYRNAQEQIAKSVKAFGGNGKIHGYIIDIDFLNHIMLNPADGSLTYYYSPMFGAVEIHNDLMSLLDSHNRSLADQYHKQLKLPDGALIPQTRINVTGEITNIDIKNSVYANSNRMNQLQRLFDNKILRDWNEELLLTELVDIELNLPIKE